jgi:hypothetical protein
MGLLIVGVIIGIIVAVIAMNKKSPESRQSEIERNLALIDGEHKERESRHQRQWLPVIDRLPIVDPASSVLLHSPIYDCASDEFELPCLHHTYEQHDSSVHGGMMFGFVPAAKVKQTLINFSEKSDEGVAFIDAGDHAYLIYTDSLIEPGSKIYRFVRTGPDEFHVYGRRSGMSPSAGKDDPPYHVRDFSGAPNKWIKRMHELRERWALNNNYQSALRRCSHL